LIVVFNILKGMYSPFFIFVFFFTFFYFSYDYFFCVFLIKSATKKEICFFICPS